MRLLTPVLAITLGLAASARAMGMSGTDEELGTRGDPVEQVPGFLSSQGENALAQVDERDKKVDEARKKRREALERRSKGDAANAEALEKDAEAAEIRAAGLEKRQIGRAHV